MDCFWEKKLLDIIFIIELSVIDIHIDTRVRWNVWKWGRAHPSRGIGDHQKKRIEEDDNELEKGGKGRKEEK